MFRSIVVAAIVGCLLVSSVRAQQVPVTDFTRQVVINAQDALTRLGYDIGASDGQWGRRSREALNAIRAENGLSPADSLTGSSVALLHRLSPGPMTLPNPGMLVNDPVERRAWLMAEENAQVKRAQCPLNVGAGVAIDTVKPVEVVALPELTDGYVPGQEDWYSPLLEGLLAQENRCLTGDDAACQMIIDTVGKWADADALRLRNPRGFRADAEIPRWITNITLRNFMAGYMLAKPFAPPDAVRDASILDWFKRRVDENYFMIPDDGNANSPLSFRRQNHALSAAQVPMLFGILSGDRAMLDAAFDVRRGALKAMRDDGSIPAEAQRGARWFAYTGQAISQMLAVGEWAAAQGIDVYAEDADAVHTVQNGVRFMLDGLEDFEVAIPYAKANHSPGESSNYRIPNVSGWMFGWMPAYRERFGNDANMQRLATGTVDSDMCSAEVFTDTEKLRDLKFCASPSPDGLRLADLILTQRPEPSLHFGYPAGCVQGTLSWKEMVGK